MASVLSRPHFHSEIAAYEYVEARLWPNGPVCPFCHATAEKIGRLEGKSTRPGLRKCYACRKPFTVKIGTVFESSHVKLHLWLQAIHLMCASKKGIGTRQLQRMLGVGMKTAWFLGMRIREAMKADYGLFTPPMGGEGKTLEADETFIGRKEGTKVRPGSGHKLAVFSLVERDGAVRSFHVANVRAETRISRIRPRAPKTGTSFNWIRMPLHCSQCGKKSEQPVSELVANDTADCPYCGTIVDLNDAVLRAEIAEFAEIHKKIKPM